MTKKTYLRIDILARFLGERALENLVQQYEQNKYRHVTRGLTEPSEEDVMISSMVKEEKSVRRVAKILRSTDWRIYGALARVAAHTK